MARKQYHNTNFDDPYQEIALIKGLIYLPECITEVRKMFPSTEVFQHEAMRSIFDSMCELYLNTGEMDEMSLQFHLIKSGKKPDLKKFGTDLKFDAHTPSTIETIYSAAEGLLSLYRRQLVYNLNIKVNASLDTSMSDKDLADMIGEVYDAMTKRGGKNMEKTSQQACIEAVDDIEKAMLLRESGKISGIPTGSATLDRELGGWQEDDVVVLAARPGGFKTTAGLDFARVAAEAGFPVGIVSIEMDAKKLKARMISMETKIPYSDMRRGFISREQFTKIQTATDKLGKLPIYYYDDVSIANVGLMEVVVTEWARKYGIKMLVIDYLQYMNSGQKKFGLREDLTEVSKSIKAINRRLRIPIIELVQLSRAVEGRADMRPIMSDLKECGQIEQDASIVIGLFYPDSLIAQGKEVLDELSSPKGQKFPERRFCYYMLKSRSGGHFRVDRFVDPPTGSFSDIDPHHAAQEPIDFISTQQPKEKSESANEYHSNRVLDTVVYNSFEDSNEAPF
jgi:replicative DNA helicase